MPDPATGNAWVFGYGSLIWRPGFDYIEHHRATLHGWRRVFWQGSHDHRGTPDAPGRVVTLIPDDSASCVGMLYLIEPAVVANTFESLDHREKNGYDRVESLFSIDGDPVHADRTDTDGQYGNKQVSGMVYIANQSNEAYLGEAPTEEIAAQILSSAGPSGTNADYLFNLAEALRKLGADDSHVFELEETARALLKQ